MKNMMKFFLALSIASAALEGPASIVFNYTVVGTVYSDVKPPFTLSGTGDQQYPSSGLVILDHKTLTMVMVNGYGVSPDFSLVEAGTSSAEQGSCYLFRGPKENDSGTVCTVKGGGIITRAYGLVTLL